MAGATGSANPLRSLTWPIAVLVAIVVGAAWYVTWATADFTMAFLAVPMAAPTGPGLAAAFVVLVVMMVAMMLPSALPMVLAYRGLTRLEGGRPVRPADAIGTALFVLPYFLVWGAFSVVALLGLMGLGLAGPFTGALVLVPAVVVIAAGLYQFTRAKEVCLSHCESPMGFVMHHWRSGRAGAVRMGLRHAMYCVGCCWLFMVVLFVAGAMSLVWMGIVSVFIFAEKVGSQRFPVSRAIAVVLLAFGGVLAAQTLL